MRKTRWVLLGMWLATGLTLAAPAERDDDAACDQGLRWMEDGNLVTIQVHDVTSPGTPSGDIEMRRYQDALRLRFTGPDGVTKSILSLDGGPELIFGTSTPAQFMEGAGIPLVPVAYLMQRYPSPCAVPEVDDFVFRLDDDKMLNAGSVQVSGRVRRTGTRIAYTLHVEPLQSVPLAAHKRIDADGSWAHVAPVQVGDDTDVRGSKVVVGMKVVEDAAPVTVAEARAWSKHGSQH